MAPTPMPTLIPATPPTPSCATRELSCAAGEGDGLRVAVGVRDGDGTNVGLPDVDWPAVGDRVDVGVSEMVFEGDAVKLMDGVEYFEGDFVADRVFVGDFDASKRGARSAPSSTSLTRSTGSVGVTALVDTPAATTTVVSSASAGATSSTRTRTPPSTGSDRRALDSRPPDRTCTQWAFSGCRGGAEGRAIVAAYHVHLQLADR